MNIFTITPCDIAEIIGETNRFLFHISLVHIVSCIIDGNEELFGANVIKTLFVTAIAIILYHILCKKIVEPKLKKIRSVCEDQYIENKYINNITRKRDGQKKRHKKGSKRSKKGSTNE